MLRQKRWSTRRNVRKNKAVVQLMKLGWTYYGISKLFGETDKRNIRKIYLRDKDLYAIKVEKKIII